MSLRPFTLAALLMAMAPVLSAGTPDQVAERLRQGGYVLLIRPPEAAGPPAAEPPPPPACAPGDRLTGGGWQQALAIGNGLRKQAIQVELAFAAPGCATRHTAYLAFGADRTRHAPALTGLCSQDPATRDSAVAALRRLLATAPRYREVNHALVPPACDLRPVSDATWPACAVDPQAGSVTVFAPGDHGTAGWVACVSAETLDAWSRRKGP